MMNRNVINGSDARRLSSARSTAAGAALAAAPDDFLARLIKLIPSEVVAVYLGLDGVLRGARDTLPLAPAFWVVFGVMLVGTPLFLWRVQNVEKPVQLAVSTLSFAVWVFVAGGAAQEVVHLNPTVGAIVLLLYTFFVPILVGEREPAAAAGVSAG